MVEAALVCLASQNHVPGVELLTEGCTRQGYGLIWSSMSDPNQAIRAWADPEEATEYGATAIAVLLAKSETGYAVVQRSRKGTGFDYWMGDESDGPPFQRKAKLEISGILQVRGDYGAVRRAVATRVQQKEKQVARPGVSLPAYVIVVEFGTPFAEMYAV